MRLKFHYFLLLVAMCFFSENYYSQITPSVNVISIDVSTSPQNSSFNYDSCFALGKKIGMGSVGIYQNWTAIETSPLNYNMFIMDIANVYYPAHNMAIDLTIAPIHTNNLEVPSDLASLSFSNTVMINRFNRLLDSIKAHIPNVTLSSLVIGSEHDIYLGNNALAWANYTKFYNNVSAHAKTLWSGLKVSTELTFNGLITQNTFAQNLNSNSDYIGISYYPLNTDFTVKSPTVIPTDFANLVSLYSSKPLCFYQFGYPSSSTCNSSEVLQSQFITQTFASWDAYASNIKMIDFTWLHDLDVSVVNFYSNYYGITDTAFLEYLRTLGLRNWGSNGANKLAYNELLCQAKLRGYNNVASGCLATGSFKNTVENEIIVMPNPVTDYLKIKLNYTSNNTVIKLYNVLGKIEKEINILNTFNAEVDLSSLANGLYIISVENEQGKYLKKIIIEK